MTAGAVAAPPRRPRHAPPAAAGGPVRPRRQGRTGGRWRHDDSLASTLALATLTLTVAAGFGRLFSGGAFLLPVVLAALAAHGTAWYCRVRELPTALAAAATVLATALVGVWATLGHTTAYGAPTPATVAAALEAFASAGEAFRVVKAPAAALPGFLLATALALGISAFMADWAAFRLKATFEALIPSFTLFLFTSALGSDRYRSGAVILFVAGVLAFVLVQGLSRSRRAGAWFGGAPAGGPRSLVRAAAVLGAVGLAAGLVLGPKLPGAGEPPVVRYKNRTLPGPSNRATISPLVDIRGRLVERADVEVFTVQSNVRSYWRLTSLDTFDGTIWSSNNTYRPSRGEIGTAERLRPDLPKARSHQQFVVRRLESIWMPAAFRPQRVEGLTDVSYNRDSASLITPSESTDGLSYAVSSEVPQLTHEQLAAVSAVTPPDIADRYLALPPISAPVEREARRIVASAGARTPYEHALALQDHFHRNFSYDLEARAGHDNAALENFLLRSRRGYCEQFAGAYAVLARTLGLPARVAVGFTPGEIQGDGLYHVRDEHAHAWPEVYLHGYGWVAFEPTPGRGAPGAEPYTGLAEAQDTSGQSTTATTAPPTPTTAAQETPATSAPAPDEVEQTPGAPDGGERGAPAMVRVAVAAGAGLLLWLVVVPALHVLRRRRRRRARGWASQVLAAWADTGATLAMAGLRRRPAETMAEYAARAAVGARLGPEPQRALRDLAGQAAAAAYAPGDRSDDEAARAEDAAASVRAAVLEKVTVRERARWWLDPRPLLATRKRHQP